VFFDLDYAIKRLKVQIQYGNNVCLVGTNISLRITDIYVFLRIFIRYLESITQVLRVIHHYQPINVPTAGAQAFLMDYP
jgi:hypothetical protein